MDLSLSSLPSEYTTHVALVLFVVVHNLFIIGNMLLKKHDKTCVNYYKIMIINIICYAVDTKNIEHYSRKVDPCSKFASDLFHLPSIRPAFILFHFTKCSSTCCIGESVSEPRKMIPYTVIHIANVNWYINLYPRNFWNLYSSRSFNNYLYLSRILRLLINLLPYDSSMVQVDAPFRSHISSSLSLYLYIILTYMGLCRIDY